MPPLIFTLHVLQFLQGLNSCRSSLINRVTEASRLSIFGSELARAMGEKRENRSATDQERLEREIGYDEEKEQYNIMFPFLYEPGDSPETTRVFRNTSLLKVRAPAYA